MSVLKLETKPNIWHIIGGNIKIKKYLFLCVGVVCYIAKIFNVRGSDLVKLTALS